VEHRETAVPLKQQAVLFRASHHSAPLEIEVTQRNIPFVKFGSLKFLEAAHVKDVLAFLRFAENMRDRMSGFRVIQLLAGAGPATAARPAIAGRSFPTTPPRCRSRSLASLRPPSAAPNKIPADH
jgi:DNA helicase-2/ATP-dependent DNA helicase PcrA